LHTGGIKNKKDMNKKDTIELVNYEGPALRLKKKEEKFSLINQWGEEITEFDRPQLLGFLMGYYAVKCERSDKVWMFTEQHIDARVKPQELADFLFN
jgi:hypothetical protein